MVARKCWIHCGSSSVIISLRKQTQKDVTEKSFLSCNVLKCATIEMRGFGKIKETSIASEAIYYYQRTNYLGGFCMNSCTTYIKPEYISEYQKYHKAICLNLNRMIWNIAFLRKAYEAHEKGVLCRNDFVLGNVYKNEFELLVLGLHKTFLDTGPDVMTLPHLASNLFSKYLIPEKKSEVKEKIKNCCWDSGETVAAMRRINKAAHIFRTYYIAHTLVGETEELSVSFLDAEKVVMAACDYFGKLSFGVEDFYFGTERALLNYGEEKKASERFLEDFFRYQIISARCIEEISCKCMQGEHADIVRTEIDQINASLRN